MSEKYPSKSLEKYPRKLAFLLDCVDGINIRSLYPGFLENFPLNSDIFIFHHDNESGMNRRLKRFASTHHGVYFFPTSENAIKINLSFILGHINEKYDDLILISKYDSTYEDLCEQLIEINIKLKNHVQFRCYDSLNDLKQFLQEMSRLQNDENENENKTESIIMNYSKANLFHSCPLETKQQSSYLYRFGQLLHHLDTEHSNIHYEYCTECEQMIKNKNSLDDDTFERHLLDKHWGTNNSYELVIHPSE